MVLAAGFGTRLGELSQIRPKPLFPVCNHVLARWAVHLLIHHGLSSISLNLHHLGDAVARELGRAISVPGVGSAELDYSYETSILGTGGGIRQMAERAGGLCRTIVINGKIVTDVDLTRVLEVHEKSGNLATMVLYPHPSFAQRAHAAQASSMLVPGRPTSWSPVEIDEQNRICRLRDQRRPSGARGKSHPHLFTGIHVLEPELLRLLPSGQSDVISAGYHPLLVRDAPIGAVVHEGYFYEHSTPARYLQGNLNLLAGNVTIPSAPGPLRGIASDAELGQDASISKEALVGQKARIGAGASIGAGCVIGDGADVAAGAKLECCIVWPRAKAKGVLTHTVVTPSGPVSLATDRDLSSSVASE
jgi:mannose-1-phosphate guanylyltransferase